MTTIPPQMWESPEDYQRPSESDYADEVREAREAAERDDATSKHRHGADCGHAAVEHGDHTDYVHEGRRHFWNRDRWEAHED